MSKKTKPVKVAIKPFGVAVAKVARDLELSGAGLIDLDAQGVLTPKTVELKLVKTSTVK